MAQKQSLKARIKRYFQEYYKINKDHWVHKAEIEDLAKQAGYLGDNAGRRCRELVEDGILEKRKAGISLEYRYDPSNIYELAEIFGGEVVHN